MEDIKNNEQQENTQGQESSAVGSTTKNETNVATENKSNEQVMQLTQEELNKIIQKRLDREKKKADEERSEAEKLAKMNEAERQKALFEKEKQAFEEERKQYAKEKMELEIIKEMGKRNLPTNFANYLLAEDSETVNNNINSFETEWQKAIEKAVTEKLKGNTPKSGVTTKTNVTKEQFLKMDFFKQQEFATENPELYKEFMK